MVSFAAVIDNARCHAADVYVRDDSRGLRQDAVARKQGEERGHRAVAGAHQPAIGPWRRLIIALRCGSAVIVFRRRCIVLVFARGGLM